MSSQGPLQFTATQPGEVAGFCRSSQLIILCVVLSMAFFERRETLVTVVDKLRTLQKTSVLHHCFVFLVSWVLLICSLGPEPRLATFTAQAVIALLFWMQEMIYAARTKQCHVTHGTMVLSFSSLAIRLFTNFKTTAYLPVGWSGEGLYQFVELGTAVVIVVMLLSTVQVNSIRPVPACDTCTQPMLLIIFATGFAWGGHLDLAKDPFFDSLWAFSWFLDCFTLVPQLEAIVTGSKCGFHSASLISLSMYRLLGVFFWIESYQVMAAQKAFLLCSFQIFASGLVLMMVCVSLAFEELYSHGRCEEHQQRKEAASLNQLF